MKKTLALCCILWCSFIALSQDTLRVYSWEEALKAPRDSVYRIDASKRKWEQVPEALFEFKNLRSLDISKNKLSEIPMGFTVFKELVSLDASKNKLTTFPVAICPLTQLRKLSLSRNQIPTIPACIGYFSELVYLDLWDNPITTLPEELAQLGKLRVVDLRSILFGAAFQEKWISRMPQVKWHFDPPCNCMEK